MCGVVTHKATDKKLMLDISVVVYMTRSSGSTLGDNGVRSWDPSLNESSPSTGGFLLANTIGFSKT